MPSAAPADTLYTKAGDIISGKLLTFQDGLCLFKTRYGAPITLQGKELAALVTEDSYRMTLVNGDSASGRLVREQDGRNRMQTISFGTIDIHADAIQAMTRIFESGIKDEVNAPQARSPSFGEDGVSKAPVDFLTGSTVLLAPGKMELEFGLQYKHTRSSHSLMNVGYFQMSAQEARQLELATTVRAGLWGDVEAWFTLPFTHTGIEQISSNQYVRNASQWALGDVSAGLQYQWLEENAERPALSLSLTLSAPTGKKRYYAPDDTWLDPLSNGTGHWSLAPGIAFVRSSDPGMLFGGVNYRFSRERTIDGYRIHPGDGLSAYLGVGFALNERLSLGSRLSLAHYRNMQVDGQAVAGSGKDPLDLSLSVSYRLFERWTLSPQVTFGLNEEAGPAYLSLRMNRRFQ
ncbi:transporter [Herbaspirillum seropedicae]|uniref:transporter n=1 Tax=Herbaspirillum seropedicae TaxID=964 RepID=UPI003F8D790E